jgi:SAM-dependent methyltransferase
MTTDYDKIYSETPRALGPPTRCFIDFFEAFEITQTDTLDVLDLGCGQGRDALFIARMGHRVVGVDSSGAAVSDLGAEALRERLDIKGYLGDIRSFTPGGDFDVILFDRVLHMFADQSERHQVLARYTDHLRPGGHLLIADEPSNMAGLVSVLEQSHCGWHVVLKRRGTMFLRAI